MFLFNYVKMDDKFSVFAELHQTEELGPILTIIPACEEAKRLVQMMNKQVTAFLFYFLTVNAALPSKFIMDLLKLKVTCDATLVAEILDYEWDPTTQTITTPHKKKENEDIEEIENGTWWNNAFNLREMGKKPATRAADKNQKHYLISMRMLSASQPSTTTTSIPLSSWTTRTAKVRDRPPQSIPAW